MHVVMFGDQHLESLGGAQVSMRLQRRFLEKAGHTVTVVAPRMHGPRAAGGRDRMPAYLDLPSVPITLDREYSLTWPGRRTDRFLDAAMRGPPARRPRARAGGLLGRVHRPPVRRAARPAGRAHDAQPRRCRHRGDGAASRVSCCACSTRGSAGRSAGSASRSRAGRDGWSYLRRFAERSDAVTAPSSHFARRLEQHGVVPGRACLPAVDVVWNGIDDDVLDAALASALGRARAGAARGSSGSGG